MGQLMPMVHADLVARLLGAFEDRFEFLTVACTNQVTYVFQHRDIGFDGIRQRSWVVEKDVAPHNRIT